MPAMDDPRVNDILDIVATETQVPREKLVLDARIDELGIASLDIVQAIFAIESKYDIEIPPLAEDAGTEFTTVGDLVGHVLSTLDKAAASQEQARPAE